jgi:mono/diheme cytochrome c family protein
MGKYNALALVALLIIIALVPFYAVRESARMETAQVALSQQRVRAAAALYLEDCASCHGTGGEGLGAMPALNNPAFAQVEAGKLFNAIAGASHGSGMAAWHMAQGGILTTYEVESLVTLIREADWQTVSVMAVGRTAQYIEPQLASADLVQIDTMTGDPHECRACHEEPAIHADRFGLNCARCHGLESWKPALLTRHTFALDHGGDGKVACETCHTTTYSEHTCYGCHDHIEAEMETVHAELDIFEIANCVSCHPTGEAGEGTIYWSASASPVPDGVLVNRKP